MRARWEMPLAVFVLVVAVGLALWLPAAMSSDDEHIESTDVLAATLEREPADDADEGDRDADEGDASERDERPSSTTSISQSDPVAEVGGSFVLSPDEMGTGEASSSTPQRGSSRTGRQATGPLRTFLNPFAALQSLAPFVALDPPPTTTTRPTTPPRRPTTTTVRPTTTVKPTTTTAKPTTTVAPPPPPTTTEAPPPPPPTTTEAPPPPPPTTTEAPPPLENPFQDLIDLLRP